MPLGILSDETNVKSVLAEACARNSCGEIHYSGRGGELRTARIRLLRLEDGVLCTDKPQNIDDGVDLCAGQSITIYFVQDNARLAFDSRVQKLPRLVQLNDRQRVVGMAIRLPDLIRTQQRRRDYRVSVLSLGIHCDATPESEDYCMACDRGAASFSATVCNVSGRGIGLVTPHTRETERACRGRLFLVFSLPGTEEMVTLAQVRHIRVIPERGTLQVGMRFVEMPSPAAAPLRHKLAHFVAHQQRKALRRRR